MRGKRIAAILSSAPFLAGGVGLAADQAPGAAKAKRIVDYLVAERGPKGK